MKCRLHRRNRRSGARVSGKTGEGRGSASLFDVVHCLTSGEVSRSVVGLRYGNDIRAVDHLAGILAHNGKLRHRGREIGLDLCLVVCVTHEGETYAVSRRW